MIYFILKRKKEMISRLFKASLPKLFFPLRPFASTHEPPQSHSPMPATDPAWEQKLDAIRKSELTPQSLIQHLENLAHTPLYELPNDIKKTLDEFFEDNFKKITAPQAVELAKHCSKLKGTEHCFWIWYNIERIVKPEIFNLPRPQLNDLAAAYAKKAEGTEMLWYDIYRAFCKFHADLKFLFKKGVPINYDEAYVGKRNGSHHSCEYGHEKAHEESKAEHH